MSSLYNNLIKDRIPYQEEKVRNSIKLIRRFYHSKKISNDLMDRHKLFVYNSLSDIIVKGVNNFFGKVIKDVKKERIKHTKDDIVLDLYCLLDKCMEKFDFSRENMFFFYYYNKAVLLRLIRIKERNYRFAERYDVDFGQIERFENHTFTNEYKDPLILEAIFSDREMIIVKSKMEQEEIRVFLERTKMEKTEYYTLMKSIKRKVIVNYEFPLSYLEKNAKAN